MVDSRYLAVVGIDGLPAESWPGILNSLDLMPLTYRLAPRELVEIIMAIGTENCIVSTDFGQDYHPMPAEGFRMGIATLLQAGMEEVEVGMLVKDNPSRLMGL